MQRQLEELSIRPGKNGGHSVHHMFKPAPLKKAGAMSGGIGFDRPPSEQHNFGPDDGAKMMAHVRQALGVKVGQPAED